MRRVATLVVLTILPLALLPGVAAAGDHHEQVVNITFPVGGATTYIDSYHAPRGGGTRVHRATDLMAKTGTPVHAAVGGAIKWITGLDGNLPSYGYMIRIAGDDGRDYAYVHLGTQDGPPSGAYASGLGKGSTVRRGQLIGYVGCSGNASCSAPHLHFEIHDPSVTDPYGEHQINPYNSLKAAQARGDIPGAGAELVGGDAFVDVRSSKHREAILAIAEAGITQGCSARYFCPDTGLNREQMATFIARALDMGPVDGQFFTDVAASGHRGAINSLAVAGITSGCDDGRYCPRRILNRGQMATFLTRAFDLPPAGRDYFVDDRGNTHEDAVNRLRAAGITSGFDDGTYRPGAHVTRGQMATFLARALGLLG